MKLFARKSSASTAKAAGASGLGAGGFAAGTLVHTKEGLKPIEEIQVGDWVLSKPGNGGEQAFKRVTQTLTHPPERVVRVDYQKPDAPSGHCASIVATPNYLFCTKVDGWVAAIRLQGFGPGKYYFEAADVRSIKLWDITNIFISNESGVGWTSERRTTRTDTAGHLWDFIGKRLIAASVPAIDVVRDIEYSSSPQDLYFKLPVHNLEVEDFHTFFVGQHGVWVGDDFSTH